MADFCLQCTVSVLGVSGNNNDLKGLSTKEDTDNKLYPVVLCEGCGAIQVDHEGRCMSVDCLEKGHPHVKR